MRIASVMLLALAALSAVSAQTTYVVPLTGDQNSPAVTTDSTATAYITFNTDSQNITYDLDFNAIPLPLAAHIHVNAAPGNNGSVGVPLWQSIFAPEPDAPAVTGRVASSTVIPAGFVGPLEVLPFYNNVDVSQLLTQYIEAGLAYVQVHTMEYPDGFIRGDFNATQVVDGLIVTPQPNTVSTVPQTGTS